MKTFKEFREYIAEASIMQAKYVVGDRFIWNGAGIKQFADAGYEKGDVFAIVNTSKKVAGTITNAKQVGDVQKYVEGPDKKVWLFKGNEKFLSSNFSQSKDDPTGAEWESLIVYAYNKLKGQKTDPETEQIAFRFWSKYNKKATEIAKNFDRNLKAKRLIQTGTGLPGVKLGKFWVEEGAKNKTPKTDIASFNFTEKISLKKAGGSQGISSEKKESIAIVRSALYEMGASSKFGKDLINEMEEKMSALISHETVNSIKSDARRGVKSDDVVDFQKKDKDNKELSEIIQTYINSKTEVNFLFSKHVVFEVATGKNKFGSLESPAAANLLGKFDVSTGEVVTEKIESVDSPIIVKYAKNIKPYVSFKKSGDSPAYSALRFPIKESTTMKDILLEECGQFLLNEEVLNEDAFGIIQRLKGMGEKVKGFLMNAFAKIKTAFQAILKKGKEMFDSFLSFLGLKIDNVTGIPAEITL
jgi:hypothetical protein